MANENEILADVKKIAGSYGMDIGAAFTRKDYIKKGKYSLYDLYDGGRSWQYYCEKAGYKTKAKKEIPDKVYFERLKNAVETLGRLPLTSEKKNLGLSFSKKRWANLDRFFFAAKKEGYIKNKLKSELTTQEHHQEKEITEKYNSFMEPQERHVPPIPKKAKRNIWIRTGVPGFPYAPQDESGVIALFSIFCANRTIPWQILSLNGGKGIDATCFDEVSKKEIEVELKYKLTEHAWNHHQDKFDYIVCWDSKWTKPPSPVIELKDIIEKLEMER